MTKGKRRYLVALVENAGACWWCKQLLPGQGWVRFCSEEHSRCWSGAQIGIPL